MRALCRAGGTLPCAEPFPSGAHPHGIVLGTSKRCHTNFNNSDSGQRLLQLSQSGLGKGRNGHHDEHEQLGEGTEQRGADRATADLGSRCNFANNVSFVLDVSWKQLVLKEILANILPVTGEDRHGGDAKLPTHFLLLGNLVMRQGGTH